MRVILVNKLGMTLRTRGDGHLAGGEQGETEALLRHLSRRRDCDVIYYGTWLGDRIKGVEVAVPAASLPLDNLSLKVDQQAALREDDSQLGDRDIAGIITVQGISPTWSMLDNAKDAGVYAFAVKRVAPIIYTTQARGLKRIVINNDPRSYPREQEMSYGYPHWVPAAILDQCERNWRPIVGGQRYEARSVPCHAECWPEHPECTRLFNKSRMAVVVGHAHIQTGYKRRSSIVEAWQRLLPPMEFMRAHNILVVGEGWEYYPGYDPSVMVGQLPPVQVEELLADSVCGLMLHHTQGFSTSKLRAHVEQNCIPLLLGVGPHAYDSGGKYVPMASHLRVISPEHSAACITDLSETPMTNRWEWLSTLRAATQPRWNVLDACVDCLLQDEELPWDAFGGYRRAD